MRKAETGKRNERRIFACGMGMDCVYWFSVYLYIM